MNCENCNNQLANVLFTQVVDGIKQQKYFCEKCADANGVLNSENNSLALDLINENSNQTNIFACPNCGFTKKDLNKTGRLGCSSCYSTFSNKIEEMIANMHKDNKHVGKIPKCYSKGKEIQDKIQKLQVKLKNDIENENYESAAFIRDEINKLKNSKNLT